MSTLDIIYSMCGKGRVEELKRSITSMLYMTDVAHELEAILFRIHIITDGNLLLQNIISDNLRRKNLCFVLHEPYVLAAPLFAPCSTQRLYLHEMASFRKVHQVRITLHCGVGFCEEPQCCRIISIHSEILLKDMNHSFCAKAFYSRPCKHL